MKFDVQHISVKEHWKDWFYDAFQIYKRGMLSHTAIYLSAFMVMFCIYPLLSDGLDVLFLLFYFVFIAPYFLIYLFGMLYKKDKSSPDFKNINFSINSLKRVFKLQSSLLGLLLLASLIPILIAYLFGASTEANADSSTGGISNYDIYDFLQFTGLYSFKHSSFILFFALFVLYSFCEQSLLQSSRLINLFIFTKNNIGVSLMSLLIPVLMINTISLLPPVFKMVYIVLVPYMMSWHYVVFKHGFFGMKPEKQEERKKVDNNTYHMS